jgi:hypothetical protein
MTNSTSTISNLEQTTSGIVFFFALGIVCMEWFLHIRDRRQYEYSVWTLLARAKAKDDFSAEHRQDPYRLMRLEKLSTISEPGRKSKE